MVDNAHNVKWGSSVRRLTQRARLRFPDAKLGETIYEGRGIDGVLVREALTCQFMDRAANVIVEGDTGTGMSSTWRAAWPSRNAGCAGARAA